MDEHPLDAPYSEEDAPFGVVATADDDAEEIESPELEQQRAEVEQTRAAVSDTIEAIREKLNPHHLVEQAKETVREATVGKAQEAVSNAVDTAKQAVSNVGEAVSNVGDTVRDTGSSILDTIRENPVPAALIAIGLGWLYMSSKQRSEQERLRERQRAYYNPSAPRGVYTPSYQSAATAYRPGAMEPGAEGGGIGEKVDQVRQKAGEVVDRTQEAVGEFVDRAQDTAGQFVDRAKDAVGTAADAARDAAGNVSEAARSAGSTVWETVQANPVPAALAAFSLAWFFTSARRSNGHTSGSERWESASGSPRIAQWDRELRGSESGAADASDVYYRSGYRSYRSDPTSSSSYSSQGGSEPSGIESFGDQVQQTVQRAGSQVQQTVQRAGSQVQQTVQRAGSQFQDWVNRSPATAGAAAITLGAVAGLLIPESRREHQLMGEVRDNLVEKAQQTAQELGEKAQNVAQHVIQETAGGSGGGNGGQGGSGSSGGGSGQGRSS